MRLSQFTFLLHLEQFGMKIRRVVFLFVVLAVLPCLGFNIIFNHNNPEVNLPGQGRIAGSSTRSAWSRQTVWQFLGVPYAESPSGALRFKPPVPKRPWDSVLEAKSYARSCPVTTNINQTSGSEDLEDCLSLCVYTKRFRGPQPVMLYIYGGGFVNGSSADHPPHFLLEKDIVLVVPQFRVGALGWASTRSENIPGNSGFMDVLLALEWVQKYISHFGGDPNDVTIVGQSAGAAIASLLTMSAKVPDGLFHKAIVQSGTIVAAWGSEEDPVGKAGLICSRVGCENCNDAKDIEKCLMNVSVEDLITYTAGFFVSPSVGDFYQYLPESTSSLVKLYGRKYPLMTGATKHDGSFILASFYDALTEQFGPKLQGMISPRECIQLLLAVSKERDQAGTLRNVLTKLIFNSTELDNGQFKPLIPGLIDFASIVAMKSPILTFIQSNFQHNRNDNFLYTFNYKGENTRFGYEMGTDQYPFNGGVHHSDENLYIFPTHQLNADDTEMAKTMVELWTSFIAFGKPSLNGQQMPAFKGDVGPYFRIDKDITIGADFSDEFLAAVNDPEREQLIRPEIDF